MQTVLLTVFISSSGSSSITSKAEIWRRQRVENFTFGVG